MESDPSRSEQVIENFKKRKLAGSAMRKIHRLLEQFEADRETDARIAWAGLLVIIMVILVAVYFFFSADSLTLS